MLKIYNIKEKQEFLREVAILTQKEWGSKTICHYVCKRRI